MAQYVFSRRRVKPGMADRYIRLSHELSLVWRSSFPGYSFMAIAANLEDPLDVAALSRWTSEAVFQQAYHSAPPSVMAQFANLVEGGLGRWEWFDVIREVEVFTGRASVVEFARFEVRPEEHEATVRWMLDEQEARVNRPGVLGLRVLQSVSTPGLLLAVGEFESEAHYRAFVEEALRQLSPLPGVYDRFSGSLRYLWRRFEPGSG
jgi:heme-degrading monooxygenase HmoA